MWMESNKELSKAQACWHVRDLRQDVSSVRPACSASEMLFSLSIFQLLKYEKSSNVAKLI